jgi:hypothetical protein
VRRALILALVFFVPSTQAQGADFGAERFVLRPSLEQIAYRYWGARLERVCPNQSLRIVRYSGRIAGAPGIEAGYSTAGDCTIGVRASLERPEACDTALHEAGHVTGLDHDAGGIMSADRQILQQVWIIRPGERRVTWGGDIEPICKPSHRFR